MRLDVSGPKFISGVTNISTVHLVDLLIAAKVEGCSVKYIAMNPVVLMTLISGNLVDFNDNGMFLAPFNFRIQIEDLPLKNSVCETQLVTDDSQVHTLVTREPKFGI